jgi:ABC-type cobalt transport system substrate-binding protein
MVNRQKIRAVAILIILAGIIVTLASCKTNEATRSRKEAEKKEATELKEIDKEYEKGVEAHFKMQSKETQKMIRQAKKRNEKLNRHRKKSWFRRVFDSD